MRYRRLLPDPAEVEADDQLTGLRLAELAPSGRPWVVANFVASLDGRAAFRGRSGPFGSDGDREMFHRLRTQVDAVLAGTGTVAAETYGRLAREPERRAQREAEGLDPDPPLILVSRSGRLPLTAPLFDEPAQRVIAYVGGEIPIPDTAADLSVHVLDHVSFRSVLSHAHAEHGIRSVLCEGGPTVLSALVRERAVDELFLTLSPRIVGGGAEPTITNGPELPELAALELRWALEREGVLFLRYRFAER
jgi:5-amino-6-(5-phosphoribosylamino)uracil reductase